MMRGVVKAGRREGSAAAAARAACRERDRLEWLGRRARGGAHPEHAVHQCDAGRVEAQRLVEHRRFLPGRREGIRRGARCGARCGPAGGRAVLCRKQRPR